MSGSADPHAGRSDDATLSQEAVASAARSLDAAEAARDQVHLLTDMHPAMTMADAYAIQAAWVAMKRDRGDVQTGWKIGLTSKAMQAALSIDIPDSGVLLRSMAFADGATIPAGRFIQPRIEAEIAFVMKHDVDPQHVTPQTLLEATDHIAPVLEILDTRIFRQDPVSGRLRTVLDTISDNAANGGYVLGTPFRGFRDHDLRWIGAIVARDGEVEETGLGAGVLGDPLVSLAWLCKRLALYGSRVEAGQIILSGSFIRPIEAPSGVHIHADFGVLGTIECRFG